jgi:hypothetical protein
MEVNQPDPNEIYTITEVQKNGFLYWIDSSPTVTKWVDADMKGQNILKAVRYGRGTATRYYIKGENIIKYIASFEDGSLAR